MIVTMFALVELCVRTKNRNVIGSIKNRYFFGKFDIQKIESARTLQ